MHLGMLWERQHVSEDGGVIDKRTLVYLEFDIPSYKDDGPILVPELLVLDPRLCLRWKSDTRSVFLLDVFSRSFSRARCRHWEGVVDVGQLARDRSAA